MVPSPHVELLSDDGLGFEWHEHGLNIELRFRGGKRVYVVIEDARGVAPAVQDYDHDLIQALAALRELSRREAALSA